MICPSCGAILDKRNLKEMLSHGWIDPDTGKHECYIDVNVPHDTIAMKKVDSVQWLGDKRIDLN
jgi:hypothetical protein